MSDQTNPKDAGKMPALQGRRNEVRHDLLEADARQIAATLSNSLVHYLLALNKGGADPRRLPRFEFDTSEPEDLALYADALPKLAAAGAQIPVAWVGERLRIPVPKEGEAVLGVPPSPPRGGAGGEGTSPAQLAALVAQASRLPPLKDAGGTPALQDAAARQAERLAGDSAGAMADLIAGIGKMVESAASIEALQAALVDAYGHLDTDELTRVMALAFAAAELAGMVEVRGDA